MGSVYADMRPTIVFVYALIVFTGASVVHAQARRTNRSTNVSVNRDSPVTDCHDIQVSYDRQAAITEESEISLPAAQVSTLKTQMGDGGIYINGWDRNDYSVKTCKA